MSLNEKIIQYITGEKKEVKVNPAQYGAFTSVYGAGSAFLTPQQIKNIEESVSGTDLNIPTLKSGNVVISNARKCDFGGESSIGGKKGVIFKTLEVGLTMKPNDYINNAIGYNQDLDFKIGQIRQDLLKALDLQVCTFLDTNKTQIHNSGLVGTEFDFSDDKIKLTTDKDLKASFLGSIESLHFANEKSGNVDVIGSSELIPTLNYLQAQGADNAVNYAKTLGAVNYAFTNQASEAGTLGAGYFLEQGAVTMVTRLDQNSKINASTSSVEFGMMDIGLPFDVGVSFKSDCAENGQIVEKWSFHFDVALIAKEDTVADKPSSFGKFVIMPTV